MNQPSIDYIFVSVNEVADKADEAISALVNNNLLKTCTFQGETSDWMPFKDNDFNGRTTGTIHVTGESIHFYFLN